MDTINGVTFHIDHILKIPTKRSGRKIEPTTLTIHSTANPKSTARNERDWLTNPSNTRSASWHECVDEKEVIQAIPLDEEAYHAGDRTGNRSSISLEICESGDREKTMNNAVKLVAYRLYERGWEIDKLRRHFNWSGKICPKILADNNWALWEQFKKDVHRELQRLKGDDMEVRKEKILLHGHDLGIHEVIYKDGVRYFPENIVPERMGYQVLEKADKTGVNINYK